jgi:hypothetical protein
MTSKTAAAERLSGMRPPDWKLPASRWWLYALAAVVPGSLPILGVLWLVRVIRQEMR